MGPTSHTWANTLTVHRRGLRSIAAPGGRNCGTTVAWARMSQLQPAQVPRRLVDMAGRTNESTAPRPVQPTEWHRLSVNVADDVADAIGTLRDRHGWSITEVVRRAVSALKFID